MVPHARTKHIKTHAPLSLSSLCLVNCLACCLSRSPALAVFRLPPLFYFLSPSRASSSFFLSGPPHAHLACAFEKKRNASLRVRFGQKKRHETKTMEYTTTDTSSALWPPHGKENRLARPSPTSPLPPPLAPPPPPITSTATLHPPFLLPPLWMSAGRP